MQPSRDIEDDTEPQRWLLTMRVKVSLGCLCYFLIVSLLFSTNAPKITEALRGLGQPEPFSDDGGNVSGPELVWSRIYGVHRIDRVTGIARHQDGGYVVVQTRFNYDWLEVDISDVASGGGGMIVLTKIDSAGNKVWERNYGDDDKVYHTTSIVESGDGGFIVAAAILAHGLLPDGTLIGHPDQNWYQNYTDPESCSNALHTCLLKIDGDGQVVWEKYYKEMYRPYSLVSDGDGGFLLAGVGELGGAPFGPLPIGLLMGISQEGDKTWEEIYWGGGSSVNHMGPIMGTGDGRFVAITTDDFINNQIFSSRISSPGTKYPSKQLPLDGLIPPQLGLAESGDGGIMVSYPAGILKLDQAFNTIWNRTVLPPMMAEGVSRSYIVGLGDGGVVAATSWISEQGGSASFCCRY